MPSPRPSVLYLADLQARGLLPLEQTAAIAAAERAQPFSLHYELRALLYLDTTLLAGGLGMLIHQNIDSIGHGVIIAVIRAHGGLLHLRNAAPTMRSCIRASAARLGCFTTVSRSTYGPPPMPNSTWAIDFCSSCWHWGS